MKKCFFIVSVMIAGVLALSYPPVLVADNPSLMMTESRKYFALEGMGDFSLMQNLLYAGELYDLFLGEGSVTINKDRLKMLDYLIDNQKGFIMALFFRSYVYAYLGFGNSRVGLAWSIEGDPSVRLPYDFMRVLVKDVSYDESIETDFNLLGGEVFTKLGLFYGGEFGDQTNHFLVEAEMGIFSPLIWVDPNSKTTFYYRTDPSAGTLETGFEGKSVILTPLGDLSSPDFTKIFSSIGYYASVGAAWLYTPNPLWNVMVGFSINNLSLPAYVRYKSFGEMKFGVSLENLNPEITEPELKLGGLEEMSEASPVGLPLNMSIQTAFDFLGFGMGIHAKFIPGSYYREMGMYASAFNIAWIDVTWMPYSFWRKSLGLDLDFRFARLNLAFGVIDRELLNVFPQNSLGFYAQVGMALGW